MVTLLARRLEHSRILLAAAYRPHELAQGRDGERHPLEPVLADFRTRFGDAWLDLAAADEVEGRTFVERYLDTEPNTLDEPFRQALYGRTRGHPLFTVELLRAMQGRGDLARATAGCWAQGNRLEFGGEPGDGAPVGGAPWPSRRPCTPRLTGSGRYAIIGTRNLQSADGGLAADLDCCPVSI